MANPVAAYPRLCHDWLKHETDPVMGRREATIASGSGKLGTGVVLGKVTASGKYKPLAPAATDGTEAAAAILILAVDATAADVKSSIVVADAKVASLELTWPAGITTNQKNAALAQLAALNIQDVRVY